MKRFYPEYDEEEDGFFIRENEGGCEHGEYYDITHFFVKMSDDATDAVNLLNKLYEKEQYE